MNVATIVVTYNRSEMLTECLNALLDQTININMIYVIDNCSTDDTESVVRNMASKHRNIEYVRLERNVGGAGGFNYGIRLAYSNKHGYLWIMDDDTIPYPTALEKMFDKNDTTKDWGLMCSNVLWVDGTPCIMNVPHMDKVKNRYAHKGLIDICSASFVSVLIKSETIGKVGLPIKEFFIWGDDVEFTSRIKKYFECFLVTDSIVIHKMSQNEGISIVREKAERINRHFYRFRNHYYIARRKGLLSWFKYSLYITITLLKIIFSNNKFKLRKIFVVLKGYICGIVFHPQIERIQ